MMPNNPMYGQNKLDKKVDDLVKDGSIYRFGNEPVCVDALDGGDPDGVNDNIMIVQFSDGLHLNMQYTGTQTLLAPLASTTGVNFALDQTDDEGVNLVMSSNLDKGITAGPFINRFTVGSDAFFATLELTIADVSGTDDLQFGFRKVEAFQVIDGYDEMAALGIITSADPAAVQIQTILNGAANVETDTGDTLADGVVAKWGVYVSSAGAVTYKIDNQAPSTTAAFSFDAGEVVTPFFQYINHSDVAGNIILRELEVGRQ
jgi:hypothetical protein